MSTQQNPILINRTPTPSKARHSGRLRAAPKRCATVRISLITGLVLENIVIDSGAFTHALSWVFSRPNTLVYGRDGANRKAARMAESMFSTSRPPALLENDASGLQSHSGAETMTTVNTITTPTAAPLGNTPTLPRYITTGKLFAGRVTLHGPTTVRGNATVSHQLTTQPGNSPTTSPSASNSPADALRLILAEVTPGIRPYSSDSWFPGHLIDAARAALESHDQTDPVTQQHAFNALSTAAWHVARGEPAKALARMRRAQSHIKASMEGGAA